MSGFPKVLLPTSKTLHNCPFWTEFGNIGLSVKFVKLETMHVLFIYLCKSYSELGHDKYVQGDQLKLSKRNAKLQKLALKKICRISQYLTS